MPTIVGVKLRFASKVLSFDPADTEPEEGDMVIVETERGSEIGEVLEAPHDVDAKDLAAALKPVLRIADDDDLAHAEELLEQEREAMPVFRELVKKHDLDMKPIDVEYLFDGSKVVFYFSAEERVDFRELVRDLASRFKARIDMRQVGVRDEARMVGGIAHCGQPLCCVRFPGDFQPVSIRMAKEQDLPLNPLKISGLCGRLMCCLRYEYDAYKDFKSRAPKRRATIDTPLGPGKVQELNTPRETATIRLEDGQRVTVPVCEMKCGAEGGRPCSVPAEAMEKAGAILPVSSVASEGDDDAGRGRPGRRPKGSDKPSDSRGGRKESRPKGSGSGDSGDASSDSKKSGGSKSGGKKSGRRRSGKKSGGSKSAADAKQGSGSQSQSGSQPREQDSSGSSGRRRRRRRTSRGENTDSGSSQS